MEHFQFWQMVSMRQVPCASSISGMYARRNSQDDLLIMAPRTDTVLFAPLSQPKAIETMKTHAEQAYTMGTNKINTDMYLFTRDGKELFDPLMKRNIKMIGFDLDGTLFKQ